MLSQLYIENVAVIEKISMDFAPGLNILTGETGAGKSIVIDSINAILGKRTSKDIIRHGTTSALMIATFNNLPASLASKLNQMELSIDSELLIQRRVNNLGKSNCKVNLMPSTVAILKNIGSELISIHGQNDAYDLLSKSLHIHYIDSFGSINFLVENYQVAYKEMLAIKSELDQITTHIEERLRRIDILEYQIKEIEDAHLDPLEWDTLKKKRSVYVNSEKISQALKKINMYVDGNESLPGARDAIQKISSIMNDLLNYLPGVKKLSSRIDSIYYEFDDCYEEIKSLESEIDYDPYELDQIENRLNLIQNLSMKYGATIEDILNFQADCKTELEKINTSDQIIKDLADRLQIKKKEVEELAQKLSEQRKIVASKFTKAVKKELKFLDMSGVQFLIYQKECPCNSMGCDDIEFLISTNPGEPPKALSKIASGGELSRIMLAIKTVLADKDNIDTLIFDEVDTGISGSAAQKVGLKLKEVSKNRQVICITHSAQIAAYADRHFLIKKNVEKNKTFTIVKPLNFTERKYELARIIGGVKITDLTLKNASEMLKMSNPY